MFAQNFTILPQSHFELIQLGIIAYIFCKTMKCLYKCIKKYEYIQKKKSCTSNIFLFYFSMCVQHMTHFAQNIILAPLRFGSIAYFSLFLHIFWLFPKKISNAGALLLCIIANIFCKSMNYMYHCQIFILMHKKGYYKYFPTSCILFTAWLFCPKFAKFRPIQLGIIDCCIFGKFMNQHCKIIH